MKIDEARIKEFKDMCTEYYPGCTFNEDEKMNQVWCHTEAGDFGNPYDCLVGLVKDGDAYSVNDQWRDCTITGSRDYVIEFLKKMNKAR